MRLASVILAACVLVSPCVAADIYVATTGADVPGNGGSANPYRTIKYACNASLSGDVIRARAGTYNESWITIKGGTEVISEDGLHAAKIYSGNSSAIRLTNNNSGIDGFEVYGNWNQGTPIDGLIRPLYASNVWVKNCIVRDAPYDGDVIKIGASNVLIENCIIYNAAHRTNNVSYQECIDTYGTTPIPDGVTVRGCWIFHTPDKGGDYLIYAKGGSKNVVWENNVFGPAGGYGNVSTGCGAASPAVFPSCENFIARNNLFLGGNGDGAFGFTGAKNAHVYNNVFYDYLGGRCFIQFYSAQPSGSAPQTDRNEDCYVFNNIFMKSNGYPIYQDRGRWTPGVTYIPDNLQHDSNLYYQANDGGDVDILSEVNSVFDNPALTAPALPDVVNDTYASVVANFLLQAGSPAIDAGADLSTGAPYDVLNDIQGESRPAGGAYDIGADEVVVVPALVSSEPAAESTLAKAKNNVIELTFDAAITGPALDVVAIGDATNLAGSFAVTVAPDGVTCKAVENGTVLVNQTWYRITPAAGFAVQPFTLDVCKLIGDADGNGQVLAGDLGQIWAHNAELTDARYDTNGDGQVLAADLGVTWSHNAEAAPAKP